jgi:thiosulfate dehydrogenase
MTDKDGNEKKLRDVIFKLINVIICLMLLVALVYINFCGVPEIFLPSKVNTGSEPPIVKKTESVIPGDVWTSPDTALISKDEKRDLIRYGKKLIANTAFYFGPGGIIAHSSNGMNCQNCHLDAGAKPFGNNYSAVASTYPKFHERSGKTENIYKRVNDCFERSLNGKALDTTSREMLAIEAYIKWLGKNVRKGEKPKGAGLTEIAYLDHPADPEKGRLVYVQKCQSCHANNGEGKLNSDHVTYQYPPLWGEHSYNIGAGLYRLSRFAGYVKSNMPFGASFDSPQLSDEEAWNVAAFVNSQQRPSRDLSMDWPKVEGKPIDHPFGPYADKFSEQQHKFGPFEPIAEFRKKNKKKK